MTKLQKLLSDLACSDAELSLVFTDDLEIRDLNRNYRNKDYATDVLSFPQENFIGGPPLLGDVIISLETAQRQAQSLEHSLEIEVLRLSIHGVLHLLGYEHEDVEPDIAEEMVKKEEELLDMLTQDLL